MSCFRDHACRRCSVRPEADAWHELLRRFSASWPGTRGHGPPGQPCPGLAFGRGHCGSFSVSCVSSDDERPRLQCDRRRRPFRGDAAPCVRLPRCAHHHHGPSARLQALVRSNLAPPQPVGRAPNRWHRLCSCCCWKAWRCRHAPPDPIHTVVARGAAPVVERKALARNSRRLAHRPPRCRCCRRRRRCCWLQAERLPRAGDAGPRPGVGPRQAVAHRHPGRPGCGGGEHAGARRRGAGGQRHRHAAGVLPDGRGAGADLPAAAGEVCDPQGVHGPHGRRPGAPPGAAPPPRVAHTGRVLQDHRRGPRARRAVAAPHNPAPGSCPPPPRVLLLPHPSPSSPSSPEFPQSQLQPSATCICLGHVATYRTVDQPRPCQRATANAPPHCRARAGT